MARYLHQLRRDGVFSSTWTLRGPLVTGRFRPPRGGRSGFYQSGSLRLEYGMLEARRVRLEFQSPRLSRGGDRIEGRVELGSRRRVVEVRSRGTGFRTVELPVVTGGFLWRYQVVYAPHGAPIAAVVPKALRFRVDIQDMWGSDPDEVRAHPGQVRLYEAAVTMYLAARIERETRRRAAVAGAAGGAAAGVAAGSAVRRFRVEKARQRGRERGREREAEQDGGPRMRPGRHGEKTAGAA